MAYGSTFNMFITTEEEVPLYRRYRTVSLRSNVVHSEEGYGRIENVVHRARRGQRIFPDEIRLLLSLKDRGQSEILFQTARSVRDSYFGAAIFFYGFIYFSTYCKNNCSFCFFRGTNQLAPRYRKSAKQILETAKLLARSGVHLIDLTMGEDPAYLAENQDDFDGIPDIIRQTKSETGLPVMVSPGVISHDKLRRVRDAGADWYACYQETHNRGLFSGLRPTQSYDERLSTKREAHDLGLLIEEGILSGVGESAEDLECSIAAMQSLDADQVRIMSFVPQQGTPMGAAQPAAFDRELLFIAVMRLIFPDRLIPASLDLRGLAGLKERLDAGANVVTSVIPPGGGWAGVAHADLDIENANRSTRQVRRILAECGLREGSRRDYLHWLEKRKRSVRREVRCGERCSEL